METKNPAEAGFFTFRLVCNQTAVAFLPVR